jgi:hypothetical protein
MRFLRIVAEKYKETTGKALMPWVGNLGSRTTEGAVGMSVIMMEVAKWIDTNEDE